MCGMLEPLRKVLKESKAYPHLAEMHSKAVKLVQALGEVRQARSQMRASPLQLKWVDMPLFKAMTEQQLQTLNDVKTHNRRVVNTHLQFFAGLMAKKACVLSILAREDAPAFLKAAEEELRQASNLHVEVASLKRHLLRVEAENVQLKRENQALKVKELRYTPRPKAPSK